MGEMQEPGKEKERVGKDHESPNPKPSPLAAKLQMLLGPITLMSYLTSLPLLAAGIWLIYMREYDCEDVLRMPDLRVGIGVSMIVVFIISSFVVYHGDRFLLPGFLVVMVPLVIMLTLGLAISGAYNSDTRAVPGSPFWLRRRVTDNQNWEEIKKCIYDSGTCSDLGYRTLGYSVYDFNLKKLSLIEAGCCKPPTICGKEYVNATYWIDAKRQGFLASSGSLPFFGGDCKTWSNCQWKLCFDCQTCREGYLRTIQHKWWQLGLFLLLISIFLILFHIVRLTVTMLLNCRD